MKLYAVGDKVHVTWAHPNNVYTVTKVYSSGRVQILSQDGILWEAGQDELFDRSNADQIMDLLDPIRD